MAPRKKPSVPKTDPNGTHYTTLGVFPGDSTATIHASYRALAIKHHPDAGGDHDYFCRLTEAWATLGTMDRRKRYDQELELTRNACATCKGKGTVYRQQGFTVKLVSACPKCKGLGWLRRS